MICNTNPRGKDFRIFSHKHYNHVFKYFPSTVEFRNIYFLIYYTFIRWLYWSCLKAQSPDSFGMNSTNYLKGLMDTKWMFPFLSNMYVSRDFLRFNMFTIWLYWFCLIARSSDPEAMNEVPLIKGVIYIITMDVIFPTCAGVEETIFQILPLCLRILLGSPIAPKWGS